MKKMRFLSMLLVAVMILGMMPVVQAASAAEIYDLRINELIEPMGLDDPDPVFSWKMRSETVGAAQTAYQVVVSDGESTLWDTGKVESSASIGIVYAGEALQPQTAYTATVTVWDQDGEALPPASAAFETGLPAENPFGDAKWIVMDEEGGSDVTTYAVDFDFIVDKNGLGFCFSMQDTKTFAMWQINTSGTKPLLRPHYKTNGSWTIRPSADTEMDLSAALGGTSAEVLGKPYHCRIEVDGAVVRSYVGAIGGELTHVGTYTHTASLPLGRIGLRQYKSSGNEDIARWDNVKITGPNGETLYFNDFSGTETGFTRELGEMSIEDGWMKTGGSIAGEKIYIQSSGPETDNLPAYRKSFTPEKTVVKARLYTSGLGVYETWINGQRVGRVQDDGSVLYEELKPGYTQMEDRKFYSTYDVTGYVTAGENVLSAIVTSGWWNGMAVQYNCTNKFQENGYLAKLVLTYDDGTTEVIDTDSSWKSFTAAPVQKGTGIWEGEVYDATVSTGWMLPGFDDSGWYGVRFNTEFKGEIVAWDGVPVMVREDLEHTPKAITVYEGATGATSTAYGTIVVKRTYADGDTITLNPGETLLVDFGQNFSGWEYFELQAEAGTRLYVEHGEMVNENNGLKSRNNDGPEGSLYNKNYTKNTDTVGRTIYYASGEAGESWHPMYTFYGFRYVEFTADKPVTFTKIRGQVVTSALEDTGVLVTSDKDVNQLISNARWGMYSNYLSVPTDCPQRDERQGWTADTQNFAEAGSFLNYSKSFLEKYMVDVRDAQRPDGNIPGVAPTGYKNGANWGAVGWADAVVLIPWFLYTMYGDTEVIRENWDAMRLFMDSYMAGTDGMGCNSGYGDWLSPESNTQTVKDMLGVSYYAWDAMVMAKMAEAIGQPDVAEYYRGVYETEKALYQSLYVQENGKLTSSVQSVCLYALYLDLLPNEESVAAVTDQLISNIESKGNKLGTGFLGTEIIMHTLTKLGRSDVAYKLLLQHDYPSWLYSVDQGATTIWERWDSYTIAKGFYSVSGGSFNHYSYGSVVSWMFRGMAGIGFDEENPGFKHILLAPHPDRSLPTVEAAYDSAYGTIVSKMAYEGSTWNYSCVIPANTTATIQLPVENPDTLTGGNAAGLTYVGYENGIATFEAVAGSYEFTTAVTQLYDVTVSADSPAGAPPAFAEVFVNGEKKAASLPATVQVKTGDKITVTPNLPNSVDYAVSGWIVHGDGNLGSEHLEGETLEYVVTGETAVTMVVEWVGLDSLAEGKPVTAESVNDSWKPEFLTDGIRNYEGGTNGWSSKRQDQNMTFAAVTATVELGEGTEFDRLHLYPRNFPTVNLDEPISFPKIFEVLVSDDGTSWTPIYTTEEGDAENVYAPMVIQLDAPVTAKLLRLSVTGINRLDDNGNSYVQLSELGVYRTETKADLDREAAAAVDALIEAIDPTDKTSIDKARDAYDGLTDEQKGYVTKVEDLENAEKTYAIEHTPVVLTLTGPETANVRDDEVVYTLSAQQVSAMEVVTVVLEVSDNLTSPVAEAAGGWSILAQTAETGKLTVVLGSLTGESDLMTLSVKPAAAGAATVKVTEAVLSATVGDTEVFGTADLTAAIAETTLELNIYDVNNDGVVNLLDVTRAQRWFGTTDPRGDITGDGWVTIEDLILIMQQFV